MTLVRSLGWRGCAVLFLAHAIACSDDGAAATSDDPSDGGTTGTSTMSGSAGTDTMSGTTAESSGSSVGTTSDETTSTDPSGDTSGTGSSSGTDGDSSTGEPGEPCDGPRDCQVVDTCCDCSAIPADAEPPMCEENCEQSMCAALGIDPVAQCEAGMCQVVDAGAQGCDACGEDEVCVQNVAQMVTSMCVPIPRDCGGTPTCECMGEVCEEPFDVCSDEGDGIDCICIAC